MWYAKMYFSEGREIFQYDSLGMQGVPDVQRELPFLESLLSFQELDCAEVTPMLQSIADNWSRFISEDDKEALVNAMKKLGELASVHIYFQLLYVHCYYRQTAMYIQNDRGSAEDAQMLDELRQLPERLPRYQQQIQRFFELVLDVDSAGREPQAQAARNYTYDMPKDPGLFCFHPIPLSFEPVEPGRCSPVLYSSGIRDMIDYSLELRGAEHHRAALQELQTLVSADRAGQRGVLRAACSKRRAGLSGDWGFQAVDKEAVG